MSKSTMLQNFTAATDLSFNHPRKRALIIGLVWPEPNSSASGGRIMQLIALLQDHGHEVHFASAALESEFMADLAALGVELANIALNCSSFDGYVRALNPELVIFDRFMSEEQFGWRVTENCPNALKILDTQDLHCLRLARSNALSDQLISDPCLSHLALYSDMAKREIASILRCDLSLMISEFEYSLLMTHFKISESLLFYMPLFSKIRLNPALDHTKTDLALDQMNFDPDPDIDVENENDLIAFKDRSDFIFIGNFIHQPNWDAVLYLKTVIWPLIHRQLPEAHLKIYGAYASQKVQQLHNPKTHFLIMGRAADAAMVVSQARLVLAPLRFGAGIKIKIHK